MEDHLTQDQKTFLAAVRSHWENIESTFDRAIEPTSQALHNTGLTHTQTEALKKYATPTAQNAFNGMVSYQDTPEKVLLWALEDPIKKITTYKKSPSSEDISRLAGKTIQTYATMIGNYRTILGNKMPPELEDVFAQHMKLMALAQQLNPNVYLDESYSNGMEHIGPIPEELHFQEI